MTSSFRLPPRLRARAATLALCLSAATTIGLPGQALADPSREVVEHLLAGYENAAQPEDFVRLGIGADRVLIAIARDPKTVPVRRVRALYALGHVPSRAGRELLSSMLRSLARHTEGLAVLELAACAEALGGSGPDAQGEIIPLLVHASDDVRMGAARGLARTRAPGAARLLRQRLSVERDAGVRGVVEDALVRLERDPDRSIDSGAGRK